MTPKDFVELKAYIDENRDGSSPYDLVTMGYLHEKPEEYWRKTLNNLSTVGITWWLDRAMLYVVGALHQLGCPGEPM